VPQKKEKYHYRHYPAQMTGNPLYALTEKQRLFVNAIMKGQNQTLAARTAGYSNAGVEATRVIRLPQVKEALAFLNKKHEKAAQMTRKKVMDGFTDAIEMARIQGEPATMVAGWREIARMCGYFAPEEKNINVNITAKRAVDKLETLSDDELLEMIEKDNALIEGECTEVLEAAQDASDREFEQAGYE
jgi:hypothetical protein